MLDKAYKMLYSIHMNETYTDTTFTLTASQLMSMSRWLRNFAAPVHADAFEKIAQGADSWGVTVDVLVPGELVPAFIDGLVNYGICDVKIDGENVNPLGAVNMTRRPSDVTTSKYWEARHKEWSAQQRGTK